ncbi:TPA: hypothetical protein CPT95_03645 [Candidatus Gastranaerophilales bacterium HUM_15]|nr:MAG TPA: hypothetical protein CPT95_03645 [Candidatus Gastranaerophilales bacterium HUM_15]
MSYKVNTECHNMENLLVKRLIEVRKTFGDSGYGFAKKLNIPQSTYLRYETGQRKVSADLIEKLTLFCDVNPFWLFTGQGQMFIKPDDNTLERQNDTTVKERVSHFGERLGELQDKHEYLDKDMAKLLKISEEDYIDLKLGDIEPDLEVLNRLKQCFKVSIDYLLYGE